jgi:hypothetical protein
VVLGALLALIFGAGAYLIYKAPLILSEAAFDFLLAARLFISLYIAVRTICSTIGMSFLPKRLCGAG